MISIAPTVGTIAVLTIIYHAVMLVRDTQGYGAADIQMSIRISALLGWAMVALFAFGALRA